MSPKKDLKNAVKSGDSAAVQNILENNPELLEHPGRSLYGYKLLRRALKLNDDRIVELLIEYGINVNFRNPLKTALRKSSARCIELLLKNNARFRGLAWERKSPAEFVFERTKHNCGDRKAILELLLNYGLDVSFRDKFDKNLLHHFADMVRKTDDDAVEVAQFLLDSGVPANDLDNLEDSPLVHAIYTENIQLISFLISRVKTEIMMTSALFKAAETNNVDVIDLFLTNGADILAKDAYEWTVLHCACLIHCSDSMRFLIEKGADISAKNNEDQTPFSVLDPEEDYYQECITTMIKEFSKLSFENRAISQTDTDLIQASPRAREHFELCTNELNLMANSALYPPYSFYSVFKKSISMKKLANLTKNQEIVCRLEALLPRLSYFKNDLQRIWEDAILVRNNVEDVNSKLYSVFRDYLPDVIIKKLSENLKSEDLPVE